MKTAELTAASLETFLTYAKDSGNWGHEPWVSKGNVECTQAMRGNLSDLVKKGLIQICGNGNGQFINFTQSGLELAASCGITVRALAQ